jgi:hypothetical protein
VGVICAKMARERERGREWRGRRRVTLNRGVASIFSRFVRLMVDVISVRRERVGEHWRGGEERTGDRGMRRVRECKHTREVYSPTPLQHARGEEWASRTWPSHRGVQDRHKHAAQAMRAECVQPTHAKGNELATHIEPLSVRRPIFHTTEKCYEWRHSTLFPKRSRGRQGRGARVMSEGQRQVEQSRGSLGGMLQA